MKKGAHPEVFFIPENEDKETQRILPDFSVKVETEKKKLYLSFAIVESGVVEVALYDVKGLLKIGRKSLQVDKGTFSYAMDLSGIPNGAYYLRMIVENQKIYRKLYLSD